LPYCNFKKQYKMFLLNSQVELHDRFD
jgi:hypothetical protein